ncbi:MAG: CbiX/SirB N-terminal domain-containing protein [Deltaproteobacteria bacterium]|nr:CbiX/SirB N-terminal domain-containing protein [Deltaproteobacteria bacterium]
MRAVIILGHGSRVPEAGKDMKTIATLLQKNHDLEMVEVCQMSRIGPHYPEILAKCVENGATEVVVIPYFLNRGLHICLDIPEMMQEEAKKYPHVKMIFGKHLGCDPKFADIISLRIQESLDLPDVRYLELAPRESFPVPVGQGEFVEMPPEEAKRYKNGCGH